MIIPWAFTFPAEIIVCNPEGVILEMNETAIRLYESEGGAGMIGHNLYDHHQEPARSQVRSVASQRKTIIYTTEKNRLKKLVCIAPWYDKAEYAGFVLMVLDLPSEIPNLVKD
jgi:PAS domain-containing protein